MSVLYWTLMWLLLIYYIHFFLIYLCRSYSHLLQLVYYLIISCSFPPFCILGFSWMLTVFYPSACSQCLRKFCYTYRSSTCYWMRTSEIKLIVSSQLWQHIQITRGALKKKNLCHDPTPRVLGFIDWGWGFCIGNCQCFPGDSNMQLQVCPFDMDQWQIRDICYPSFLSHLELSTFLLWT